MSTRSRTIWLVIIGALLTASFSTTLGYLATQWSGRPQRLQSLALRSSS